MHLGLVKRWNATILANLVSDPLQPTYLRSSPSHSPRSLSRLCQSRQHQCLYRLCLSRSYCPRLCISHPNRHQSSLWKNRSSQGKVAPGGHWYSSQCSLSLLDPFPTSPLQYAVCIAGHSRDNELCVSSLCGVLGPMWSSVFCLGKKE